MAAKIKKEKQQTFPDPSVSWPGSLPEWAIYHALLTLGKKPDVDFTYQSPRMGGRMVRGGVVIDFLFRDPPGLAINVQGIYYHYGAMRKPGNDVMQRATLAGMGITLIFIDEDDALVSPRYYASEALRGIDHSRLR